MTLFLSGVVNEREQVWKLEEAVYTVGRSSKNSLHIPDGTVSKEHAEITRQGERWLVRDLGSRNGTRVNAAEAREATELRPGDRLEVGHVLLRVTDGPPGQQVNYTEGTVMSSSLRLRMSQVLEKRAAPGAAGGHVLHLLAEAGQLLVLPRPLPETCDQILHFLEKAIPASRYVLLLNQEGSPDPVQVAARHKGGSARHPLALSRSIMRTVLDEVTAVLTGDASRDPRFQGQQSIVAQAVHSAMAVPLFDNEKVLGLIYVDSQDPTVMFNEEQLEVLSLLANMAAVKITNARLLQAEQVSARLEQEVATATAIQRGLLPPAPPRVPGWAFEAYLETCHEVGGDLYDFHEAGDGRVFFVVGDVSGKGMGAALLMSSFISSARVLYDSCTDLGDLCARLNAILHRTTDPKHFITAFVGCLDTTKGVLHYVNAGHPSPALAVDGRVSELESGSVPFGILPSFPFTAQTLEMPLGGTLAVFSDGIPEAQRGEEFFEERRLHEVLLSESGEPDLAAVRQRIISAVEGFEAGGPRADDITLVLVRRDRA